MMKSEQFESFPGALQSTQAQEGHIKKVASSTVRMMRAGNEDIVVGENSSLEGSFETQGSMFVDGALMGADLRTNLLSIGASGTVAGDAHAVRAEIAGTYDGRLTVSGEVILRSTSHVTGEISCGRLVSHRGATVRAQVTVLEDEQDYADAADEPRSLPLVKFKGRVSRSFMKRAISFGYGVFFTLGSLGVASYFS